MSKGCKDSSIVTTRLGIVCSRIDSISAKAFHCMCLQVGCCGTVLRVKVSTDRAVSFALLGSTLEKVKLSAILVLNQDLGFEEAIDR